MDQAKLAKMQQSVRIGEHLYLLTLLCATSFHGSLNLYDLPPADKHGPQGTYYSIVSRSPDELKFIRL